MYPDEMKLVIVESVTKAKTLSGILGKEYIIEPSVGHVRDLPKSGLGVDVENNYEPQYEVTPRATKTVAKLKKLSKDKSLTEIVLATDPDREGEAIAWHLSLLLGDKNTKFERVVFHELTKSAVLEAFSHAGKLNVELVDAQQARRVLDRLVGYKLSPLLWKKVRFGLSAGRVQSVAVRLVVERERERKAFKPEEYWTIMASFENDSKKSFKAELTEYKGKKVDPKTEKESKELEKLCNEGAYKVEKVAKSERKRKPQAPFKTSTLQQSSANVFGFTAKRTMSAAQKLFEQGLITYHRTDSLTLSTQFIEEARKYAKSTFGEKFVPAQPVEYKTKAKNAQEAHEAIRPTDLTKVPTEQINLEPEEQKVYTLIWKRALECQMESAAYDQTSVSVASDNGLLFKASGSIIKFSGWLEVGNYLSLNIEEDELSVLPEIKEGEKVNLKDLDLSQHFTMPPARYSDATLIKALEELEIGRPSTYAPTISTIIDRGYVLRDQRYFVPSDVAYVVNDLLVQYFPDVVDYKFTAEMEEHFDDIAEGKLEWRKVIKDFYEPFAENLADKEEKLKKTDVTTLETTDEECPECGHKLVVKLGKYGKFLSCSNYPDCKFAKPLDDGTGANGGEGGEDYGKCDKCEEGHFILKQGRFGKFLACNNYPKCKNAKPYLDKIGMKCPKCSEGDVVVKKAKFKVFYGCSRYPDCDYSSWTNPMGNAANNSDNGLIDPTASGSAPKVDSSN